MLALGGNSENVNDRKYPHRMVFNILCDHFEQTVWCVNLNLVYTAAFIAELNFRISKMTEFFPQRLILTLFCVQRRK
jgi:hypothetical protein